MKPIERIDLKEGDWISTSPIFRGINEKNQIFSIQTIGNILKIKDNQLHTKFWKVEGKKVVGVSYKIEKDEEIFLLEEKEINNFRKQIILINLKYD